LRQLAILLGLLASGYVCLWGATWLTGNKSYAITVLHDDGTVTATYPGVLFGGLPANPLGYSLNLPFFALGVGAVALLAFAVLLLRNIRGVNADRR
jgi:hypothetical protein